MFVKEYLIDLNATQAAIRAGYSEKTAKDIACENLAKPYMQDAIQKALDKRSDALGIDAYYVLSTIKETTESAKADDDRANVFKGCEMLGKHLKLFTDKVDHSFNPNAPLILNVTKTVLSAND